MAQEGWDKKSIADCLKGVSSEYGEFFRSRAHAMEWRTRLTISPTTERLTRPCTVW
jgi:hypothetical protein